MAGPLISVESDRRIAAIGFCPHSGWAAVICLGGTVREPILIKRRRVLLTSEPLPREPYHLAKRREAEATEVVAAAADEARTLATEAMADLAASVLGAGYQFVACGVITGRGRPDFTLRQALSTHAAIHNAEGWLFREAVIRAGQQMGLRVAAATPDAVYAETADAAGIIVPEVEARMKEFGTQLGPPWGKDQKLASAAAWLALARARVNRS